jgi:hypothetical protein
LVPFYRLMFGITGYAYFFRRVFHR